MRLELRPMYMAVACAFVSVVTVTAVGQTACGPGALLEWIPRVTIMPQIQFNDQSGGYDKTQCFPEPIIIRVFPYDLDEATFWGTQGDRISPLNVYPHRDSTHVSWILQDTTPSGSTFIDRQCREVRSCQGDTVIFYPGWKIDRGSSITFKIQMDIDDGFFTPATGVSVPVTMDDPRVERPQCDGGLPELTVTIWHNANGTYRVKIDQPNAYCTQTPPGTIIGQVGASCICQLTSPLPINQVSPYRLTAASSGPGDGFICAETPSPFWGNVRDFDRKKWDCGGGAIEYDCRDSVRYAWTLQTTPGWFVSEPGTSFLAGSSSSTAQQPICWVPKIQAATIVRVSLTGDDGMPQWYTGTGVWANFDDPIVTPPSVQLTVYPCVDVRVDSNNDGTINTTDNATEECRLGNLIPLNDDDDNANGASDLGEASINGEDDLKQLQIVIPFGPPSSQSRVRLSWFPVDGVKIFTNPNKTGEVTNGAYVTFAAAGTQTYWVEGRAPGQTHIHAAVYSDMTTARFMCRNVVSVSVVGLRFLGDLSDPIPLYGPSAALEISEMVTIRLTNADVDNSFPPPLVFDAAPTGDVDNFRVEVVGLDASVNAQVDIAVMVPGQPPYPRSIEQYTLTPGTIGTVDALRTGFVRLVSNDLDDAHGGIYTRLARLDNPPVNPNEIYSNDSVSASLKINGNAFTERSLPVFRPPTEAGVNALRTARLRLFGLPGEAWNYDEAVDWINDDLAQAGMRVHASETTNLNPVNNAIHFWQTQPTAYTLGAGAISGEVNGVEVRVDFLLGDNIATVVNNLIIAIATTQLPEGYLVPEFQTIAWPTGPQYMVLINRREIPFRANITRAFAIEGNPPPTVGFGVEGFASPPSDAFSLGTYAMCLNYGRMDPTAIDVFILNADAVLPGGATYGLSYFPVGFPHADAFDNTIFVGKYAMGVTTPPVVPGGPVFTLGLNPHIFSHEVWHVLAAGVQPWMPAALDPSHSLDPRNVIMSPTLLSPADLVHITEPDPLAAKRLVLLQSIDARADTGSTPPSSAWLLRLLWPN